MFVVRLDEGVVLCGIVDVSCCIIWSYYVSWKNFLIFVLLGFVFVLKGVLYKMFYWMWENILLFCENFVVR